VSVKLLARCVVFDSDSRLLCVRGEPSSFLSEGRDKAAYGLSLNSRAFVSSCGAWSSQRKIFSQSNCHFYRDVGSSHGSCDGTAQTERDAHPYDRSCDPVPLDLGVRQQLSLVPCAAAAGDRSSSSHLTCVDCRSLIERTTCSGSCNASAVAAKAKGEADTYAGTFSPATSTRSSAAFGTFGPIGTSIVAAVVGGWTSCSGSCNTGAVAVKRKTKLTRILVLSVQLHLPIHLVISLAALEPLAASALE
jgi:hypothetical protein